MTSRRTLVQANLHQLKLFKLTVNHPHMGNNAEHAAQKKTNGVKATSKVKYSDQLKMNAKVELERLSESVVRTISDRTLERNEVLFCKRFTKPTKRKTSDDVTNEDAPVKKYSSKSYIIEKITNFKYVAGRALFYVKWQGWSDSENTWEPVENLDKCNNILNEFLLYQELKYSDKMEKLKENLAYDNLLSEDKLCKRINEFENNDIAKVKEKLIINLLCMIYNKADCNASDLIEETRDTLQLYVLSRKRCQQLIALQKWNSHLNEVDESKKLFVENNVDLAGPPTNFTYINASIPRAGVVIPDDPPIGCECQSCNCRSKACCGHQAEHFAYTTKKRLRISLGIPIFECNKACKCSEDCFNRVVQSGRSMKLCIFRTSNGRGWGVRTEKKIKQGEFICQYVGEIITSAEADRRGKMASFDSSTYLFDLDFNTVENPYVIDAVNYGNVSHFINHSCDPNIGAWSVWANCLDPNLPLIALFSTRDIEAGEELCFDYLQKPSEDVEKIDDRDDDVIFDKKIDPSQSVPSLLSLKARFERKQEKKTFVKRYNAKCKCGAIKCRKFLF